MSPEEQAWIERLTADRPAGGVPVSAEERLLDGIREEVLQAVMEGDADDCSSPDCIADAVYEIVRHRLAGVSVPTEPGARPTHLRGVLPPIDLDGIEMRWASQWNESDDGEVRAWRDDVAALIDEVRRLNREIGPRFAICGVIWPGGPNGEPLACAWPPNPPDQPMHEHSWSWVPTPGVPTEPGAPLDPKVPQDAEELCRRGFHGDHCSHASQPVPIEPEAPDPLRDIEEAQERGYRYGYADGLASQPVPDPEPSARLREALEAWERNGAPNRKSLAAFGIRPTLAATPQDPEA